MKLANRRAALAFLLALRAGDALVAAAKADASAASQPATASAPARTWEVPTLEELLARMDASDRAMQNFAATSRTTVHPWRGESRDYAPQPAETIVLEQVVADECFRLKRTLTRGTRPPEVKHCVYDGKTCTTWSPDARQARRQTEPRWLGIGLADPRQLAFWDTNGDSRIDLWRELLQARRLKITPGEGSRVSDPGITLESLRPESSARGYRVVIDLAHGCLPTRIEEFRDGQLLCRTFDITHRPMPGGAWFPMSGRFQDFEARDLEQPGKPGREMRMQIDAATLESKPLTTPASFRLDLPPGTSVDDGIRGDQYEIGRQRGPGRDPAVSRPADPEEEAAEDLAWRARFDAVYRLEEGRAVKRIPPPFMAERLRYYRETNQSQARAIPRGPDYMQFRWNDDGLRNYGMGFGSGTTVDRALGIVGLQPYEYSGSDERLRAGLPGDWIVREDASREARLRSMEEILRKEFGRPIRFVPREVEREVVAVRGEYQFTPHPRVEKDANSVHLFTDRLDPNEGAGGGSGDFTRFLEWVGERVNRRFISEVDHPPRRLSWRNNRSSDLRRLVEGEEKNEAMTMLLANLKAQTGLEYVPQRRKVTVWFLEEELPPATQPR
jgi:hypothetical protein